VNTLRACLALRLQSLNVLLKLKKLVLEKKWMFGKKNPQRF
jgi:hypothetical protein